jgi:AraC-like DNA-binding protein
VRSELSRFWALLFQNTEEIRAQNTEKNNSDMERLKEMILYIQANYAERIMLDDIAAAAGISPRECMRCFQRCLGNSPVNYLNDHRLHMAAEKLLTTAETVTEVSENCGFSSVSYFSKAFRLKMGCTPLEYRKGKDAARE